MNRLDRLFTLKGLGVAIVFGLLAFLSVISKIHFNIPGTNMLSDPREIFVLIGAALSGPVSAILVGILAGIYDPTPGLTFYVMAQHIAGAVFVGWFYKKTRNEELNSIYQILVWLLIVCCYYSVFYLPVYYLTYFFFPSVFQLISHAHEDPSIALITIFKGWVPEFIFTAIITSIILLALTKRLTKPLWGKENPPKYSKQGKHFFLFKHELFRNNIAVRMALWLLLFTLVPILLIAVFVNNLMRESVLRTEATQLLSTAKTGAVLISRVPSFPRHHFHQIEFNDCEYLFFISEVKEDNELITSPSFAKSYLSKLDSMSKRNKDGYFLDIPKNSCMAYSNLRNDNITVVAFSGPKKFQELMSGIEWLSGKNLLISLFIISFFCGFVIWTVIARPLKKLQTAAEAVSIGDYSVKINTAEMDDDIAMLANSFNTMVSNIETAQNKIILETEKSIRNEKEKNIFATELKRISDNILDIIIKTSTDGIILFTNPAIYKIFQYDEKEIVGENFVNFVHLDDKEIFRSQIEILITTQISVKFQFRFINKDNSSVYIETIGSPLTNEAGVTTSLIFTLRDITSIKEIEESLKKAKEDAEKSNQLKTDFLAQMSHEIRTPINSILSFSRLIREEVEEKVDADIKFGFTAIENSSQRLIRTIESLLNFSQLLRKNYEVNLEPIDLSKLIPKLIEEFSLRAQNKALLLSYSNFCDKSIVISDKYIVTQIAANLIDNAIKYTEKGSVQIITEQTEDHLKLKVKDSGKGISPEYLSRLFEPFSQEETGYNRPFEGNGLGLAIVKEYCALVDADVKVESYKNVGSEFTIIFESSLK